MMAGGRRWRLVRASTDAVPGSVRRVFMAASRRRLGPPRRPGGLLPGRRRPGPGRRQRLGPPRRRRLPWAPVAAVTVLLLLGGWVLWGTSLLGVREVRVTGTEVLAAADVRQAAALTEQTPLLRVRPGEVATRVGELAPVAQVRVRRAWPDTVVIEVVERTAVAAVPTTEGFTLIDREGVGFRTVPKQPADLPVVVVPEPGPGDRATAAALTVLAALTPELAAELESLTVAGPASIQLALASGRTVVWGDESDSDRKAQVATALLDHPSGGGEAGEDGAAGAGIIDVSVPEVASVR